MKLKLYWVGALFLTGCQITQPTTEEGTEQVPTNTTQVAPSPTPKEANKPSVVVKQPTPQEQSDVWQRIAMQLEMPIPDHKKVDYYRNWYLKHPQHLITVSKRAEPFLYMITEEIEKRGLPLELALLPIVESSFDPFAYSHGRAAGLWQFVPETARSFGLEQNWWYDGRRDVEEATDAALDLMVYLNKKFDGNWSYAIAAYNSGEGRVFRAVKKNKKAGKPTDFFSLDLPKETSGYVPKLIALADVIKNRKEYGLDLPAIENKPALQRIDPKQQMDLALAAKYAGMSITELQGYNPAYNQWATSPSGPHHLLLPLDKVDSFNTNLAKNKGQGINVVRYKVKSGDTLSQLAESYRTTTAQIKRSNNLTSNNIRVGKYLLIPASSKGSEQYTLTVAQRQEKLQSASRGKYKLTHVVKSGDSFWTIARKNKVSHKTLAKWNGMSPKDPLRIGQKLVIWKDGKDGAIIRTVYYKIRKGDSLSTIAARHKVSVANLRKWNNLKKGVYIQPGQQLKLYVDVTKVSV
ncbi:LysM peptidoglycan-binding domain-containing protein [Vibrio sp. Of7-15]|uniref:LysM peptidoglycan-binding domain-containing protein n=1 Tax=Vibrio sp. Of7-15 TaxID=2724879 RepID=UPI001EF2368F|nr:LysM peptidoglycan-binding domain-containing protein [Vibrio sp. Of7-15]MCG7498411.1 LysM peptidoglycan-binding domain-containing protein [Vibrio sp. Of7-15]